MFGKQGSRARRRSPVTLLAIAALGAVAALGWAAFALAGHQAAGVDSITGCLTPNGSLNRIAEGNSPASECKGGAEVVHLAGGDITAVNAGAGLTGGGSEGAVTLGLAGDVVQDVELVSNTSATDSRAVRGAVAVCPAGKEPIGTGGKVRPTDNDLAITRIAPSFSGITDGRPSDGFVTANAVEVNPTDVNWSVTAFAICASVGPSSGS